MTAQVSHHLRLLHAKRTLFAVVICTVAAAAAESPAGEQPPLDASVAAQREKLLQQIAGADERIQRAEGSATAEHAETLGVPLEDLAGLVLTLRQTRSIYEEHLDALDDAQEIARARRALQTEIDGYTGLPEPPPYTPWQVDVYRDEADARAAQQEIAQAAVTRAKERLERASDQLARSERAVAAANERRTANADPAAAKQLEWRYEAAIAERQLHQAAVDFARFEVGLAEERLALRQAELAFAERKRDEAAARVEFRQQDLENRLKTIAQSRDKLLDALAAARAKKDAAQKRLEAARLALDQSVEDEEFAVNQPMHDLRRLEADVARDAVQTLREQIDYLYYEEELWTTRYALHRAPKAFTISEHKQRIAGQMDALRWARESRESRLEAIRATARDLTRRLASFPPGFADLSKTQQRLDALREQQDLLFQSIGVIERIENASKRLLDEIRAVEAQRTPAERWAEFRERAGGVWNYELINLDGSSLTVRQVAFAVAILMVGFLLTRLATRYLRHALRSRARIDQNAAATIERLVHYALLVLVVLFALQTVRIPLTVFTFLGGALAIGVGFGAQNLINNFISGLILMMERPIKIGDVVEIENQRGRIMEIGARCSRIQLFTGIDVLVPNSAFLERNVINWTLSDPRVRFSVAVGVAYGSPVREVAKLVLRAVEEHGQILKDPPPLVLFQDFGDSALVFEAHYWLNLVLVPDSRTVASDVRFRIERLFREAGISIAFPQRDVHVSVSKPVLVQLSQPGAEPDSSAARKDEP